MKRALGLFAWLAFAASAAALDNGALPIPLLGWSTWNLVGNRVNETLLRSMADAMVDSGLHRAGWRWIMLDDGWTECLEHTADGAMCLDHTRGRGADGRLRPDPSLFPSGMKATVEYVHKLGLKFGIYTCVSYEQGSLRALDGHTEQPSHTSSRIAVSKLTLFPLPVSKNSNIPVPLAIGPARATAAASATRPSTPPRLARGASTW